MPTALSLNFEAIPYKQVSAPWAKITDKIISHSVIDFHPMKQTSAPWAKITELILSHPIIEASAYKQASVPWGELIEITGLRDPVDSEPDPDSTPYIEKVYSAPIPDNGAVDVDPNGGLFIPCGDRVATIEDQTTSLVDNFITPLPSPAEPVGLDPSKTIVRIRYDSGPWVIIHENGSGQNGWSSSAVSNNFSGNERDLIAGYDYSLSGTMLPGALVEVEVTLVDYGGKEYFETYSFTTTDQGTAGISNIFVVRESLIRVDFDSELAVTSALLDPVNYSITPLRPVGSVYVLDVLPLDTKVTNYIFLSVRGLKLDQFYSINIPADTLKDRSGRTIGSIQHVWKMRRTKVDTTIASLPKMYDTKSRSTIVGILEAIMISDEKIGGDY